eukprot:GHVS01106273.1.p1 GENE.GHVS01106273.1~~GHVS01106273.1.p1  ORF type:complete len:697 (-),score=114.47 GHVS01106273.1:541-2631(-)
MPSVFPAFGSSASSWSQEGSLIHVPPSYHPSSPPFASRDCSAQDQPQLSGIGEDKGELEKNDEDKENEQEKKERLVVVVSNNISMMLSDPLDRTSVELLRDLSPPSLPYKSKHHHSHSPSHYLSSSSSSCPYSSSSCSYPFLAALVTSFTSAFSDILSEAGTRVGALGTSWGARGRKIRGRLLFGWSGVVIATVVCGLLLYVAIAMPQFPFRSLLSPSSSFSAPSYFTSFSIASLSLSSAYPANNVPPPRASTLSSGPLPLLPLVSSPSSSPHASFRLLTALPGDPPASKQSTAEVASEDPKQIRSKRRRPMDVDGGSDDGGLERNGAGTTEKKEGGVVGKGSMPADSSKEVAHKGSGRANSLDETKDCYYLYLDMLLFVLVDLLAMQQVAKIFRMNCQRDDSMPPVSLTGGKTRTFFICLLVLANFARAISLGFLGYLLSHEPSGVLQGSAAITAADQHQWLLTILRSAPSLLFLSTYSVVILFWAQVYYAAILVSLPLLKPCFVFINIAAYTVYVSAVVLTHLLQAYAELATYAAFLIGIFYSATALGVAYYGVKVSNKLSERSKQPSRKNSIIRRVLFLAIVCPLAFLLRGLYSLAFAVNILPQFYPSSVTHPSWDALIFLVTEWLPSVMILAVFWHRRPSRGPRAVPAPSSSGGMNSSVGAILTNNDYTTPLVENGYSPYTITQHMPQPLLQ